MGGRCTLSYFICFQVKGMERTVQTDDSVTFKVTQMILAFGGSQVPCENLIKAETRSLQSPACLCMRTVCLSTANTPCRWPHSRHCLKHSTCISQFNPLPRLRRRCYYGLHATDRNRGIEWARNLPKSQPPYKVVQVLVPRPQLY